MDVDEADHEAALGALRSTLGQPTLVVESGGLFVDPETGGCTPKLHVYYRLSEPAEGAGEVAKLKALGALAAEFAGGDPSAAPPSHPVRAPGSLHTKDSANPRLCQIVECNDAEIRLNEALDKLRAAATEGGVPIEDVAAAAAIPAGVNVEKIAKATTEGVATGRQVKGEYMALASALAAIPNYEETPWEGYEEIRMALKGAIGPGLSDEQVKALFAGWSDSGPKSRRKCAPEDDWARSCGVHTRGAQTIYGVARGLGWKPPHHLHLIPASL